jgi:hypothetical protein
MRRATPSTRSPAPNAIARGAVGTTWEANAPTTAGTAPSRSPRRGVVDGSPPDVVQSPLPTPNTPVGRPAPIARAGYSPTTKRKNGPKDGVPETPEASALIERRIEAGNTHR